MLLDKSFIGRGADGRFALHALLQMFAAEKLAENPVEKSETQERHYLHYKEQLAEAVGQWRETYQTDSLDAIRPEVENLRAGWKWILTTEDWEAAAAYSEDLWQFLKVQGRLPEAMELLDQAIRTGQTTEPLATPIHLAHWERRIGQAYLWLSKLSEGQKHFHLAISFLEWPLPDSRTGLLMGLIVQLITQILHRAWPGYFIGRLAKKQAGIKEAFIAYEQIAQRAAIESDTMLSVYCGFRCLNLAEAAEIQPLMARAYALTGYMFGLIPSHHLAESYLNRAEELIKFEHSPVIRMWISFMSGYYYFGKGELERAERNFLVSAKLASELGQHWNKENNWTTLLQIALLRGEWDRCLDYRKRIGTSARLRGDAGFEAAALYWEAIIKLQRGEMDGVIPLLEESASAPEDVMMIFDWIIVHASFARAYCRQGELALAAENVNKLSRLIAQISRPTGVPYMLGYAGAASVYLDLWKREADQGNRSGLQASAKRACKDLRDLAGIFPFAKSHAWLYQGIYDWLAGNQKRAHRAWQKSLDYAKNLDLVYQQGLVHYEIGRHLSVGEETDDGWGGKEHLLRASEIFTDHEAAYDLRCTQKALENLKSKP
jgi:tetratricopeptide (TPR) repeat protein